MTTSLKFISTQSEYYPALLQFRDEWLRQPLGLSLFEEDLSEEQNDTIIMAMDKEQIIGCVLLQKKDEHTYKLRQMAVAEKQRGKGIGKMLINEAERYLATQNVVVIELHARQYAIGFYEALGYHAFGTQFIEVTIPHYAMKKQIA